MLAPKRESDSENSQRVLGPLWRPNTSASVAEVGAQALAGQRKASLDEQRAAVTSCHGHASAATSPAASLSLAPPPSPQPADSFDAGKRGALLAQGNGAKECVPSVSAPAEAAVGGKRSGGAGNAGGSGVGAAASSASLQPTDAQEYTDPVGDMAAPAADVVGTTTAAVTTTPAAADIHAEAPTAAAAVVPSFGRSSRTDSSGAEGPSLGWRNVGGGAGGGRSDNSFPIADGASGQLQWIDAGRPRDPRRPQPPPPPPPQVPQLQEPQSLQLTPPQQRYGPDAVSMQPSAAAAAAAAAQRHPFMRLSHTDSTDNDSGGGGGGGGGSCRDGGRSDQFGGFQPVVVHTAVPLPLQQKRQSAPEAHQAPQLQLPLQLPLHLNSEGFVMSCGGLGSRGGGAGAGAGAGARPAIDVGMGTAGRPRVRPPSGDAAATAVADVAAAAAAADSTAGVRTSVGFPPRGSSHVALEQHAVQHPAQQQLKSPWSSRSAAAAAAAAAQSSPPTALAARPAAATPPAAMTRFLSTPASASADSRRTQQQQPQQVPPRRQSGPAGQAVMVVATGAGVGSVGLRPAGVRGYGTSYAAAAPAADVRAGTGAVMPLTARPLLLNGPDMAGGHGLLRSRRLSAADVEAEEEAMWAEALLARKPQQEQQQQQQRHPQREEEEVDELCRRRSSLSGLSGLSGLGLSGLLGSSCGGGAGATTAGTAVDGDDSQRTRQAAAKVAAAVAAAGSGQRPAFSGAGCLALRSTPSPAVTGAGATGPTAGGPQLPLSGAAELEAKAAAAVAAAHLPLTDRGLELVALGRGLAERLCRVRTSKARLAALEATITSELATVRAELADCVAAAAGKDREHRRQQQQQQQQEHKSQQRRPSEDGMPSEQGLARFPAAVDRRQPQPEPAQAHATAAAAGGVPGGSQVSWREDAERFLRDAPGCSASPASSGYQAAATTSVGAAGGSTAHTGGHPAARRSSGTGSGLGTGGGATASLPLLPASATSLLPPSFLSPRITTSASAGSGGGGATSGTRPAMSVGGRPFSSPTRLSPVPEAAEEPFITQRRRSSITGPPAAVVMTKASHGNTDALDAPATGISAAASGAGGAGGAAGGGAQGGSGLRLQLAAAAAAAAGTARSSAQKVAAAPAAAKAGDSAAAQGPPSEDASLGDVLRWLLAMAKGGEAAQPAATAAAAALARAAGSADASLGQQPTGPAPAPAVLVQPLTRPVRPREVWDSGSGDGMILEEERAQQTRPAKRARELP